MWMVEEKAREGQKEQKEDGQRGRLPLPAQVWQSMLERERLKKKKKKKKKKLQLPAEGELALASGSSSQKRRPEQPGAEPDVEHAQPLHSGCICARHCLIIATLHCDFACPAPRHLMRLNCPFQ